MLDLSNVPQQQSKIDSACRIDGSVRSATGGAEPHPIVVVLARLTGNDLERRDSWQIADHFVLEQAGRWMFSAGTGTYGIVAFEDSNANLIYEPGEPFLRMDPARLISLVRQRGDLTLAPPASLKLSMEVKPSSPSPKPVAPIPGKVAKGGGKSKIAPSWWTARARETEVKPGFSKEQMSKPAARDDPRAAGGVFERVGGLLNDLLEER